VVPGGTSESQASTSRRPSHHWVAANASAGRAAHASRTTPARRAARAVANRLEAALASAEVAMPA